MDTKAVGKRISLYRDRAGMTQLALAEKIGCTPQHISAMERGVKTPTLETFISIANALQVRTDLLLQDVLEGWQEGWEAELDRTLAPVPPGTRNRIKKEIKQAQQMAEVTRNNRFRIW